MKQHSRPPIERMQWFHERLRHRKFPTAPQLAREFEVAVRTAYRDIHFLRDRLGAPVEYDPRRKGYYYTEDGYSLPSIPLTEGEVFAALIAAKVVRVYADTEYESRLRQGFAKIASRLPEPASLTLADLDASITVDVGPAAQVDPLVYDAFVRAAMRQRRLRITYRGAYRDEVTTREVDVYHLWGRDGDWYAIAHDHLRSALRHFLLSRVEEVTVTQEEFARPSDFDPQSYIATAFGVEHGDEEQEVKIRFDAYQARWIRERVWHPTQGARELDDGGLVLTFRVTSLDAVKRWALQYGSHAEVLAPASLRESMTAEVRALASVYEVGG